LFVESGRLAAEEIMRHWHSVWVELREVVWLTTVLWGVSIAGVGFAIALALALDSGAAPIAPVGGHF
jgi:hypothetical protein